MVRNETGIATKGNAGAVREKMVQDHWASIFRMMYCMTGNTHDSEDLTQEAFLRAFDRLDSFQPGTNARAWLLRIASNAFVDQARKKKRVRIAQLEADVAEPGEGPDHALETAEEATVLRVALEELSRTARLVFHLRVVEDLAFKQIAESLEISEEAARWHMHQARSKLLKKMNRGE